MDGSGNAVKTGLAVGDILHCRWGYSMVLNTYYRVVKAAPIGKYCQVQRIGQVILNGGGHNGMEKPDLECQGRGPVTKHLVKSRLDNYGPVPVTDVGIKSEYGWTPVWDGQADSYDHDD